MTQQHPKVGIVSHTLPHAQNGQAVVLARLLEDWQADSYCFFTIGEIPEDKLPGNYHPYKPYSEHLITGPNKFRAILDPIVFRSCTNYRAECIVEMAQKEKCDILIACTGDIHDLPATSLAARQLNIPYILYMFDWYAFQFDVSLNKDRSTQRLIHYAKKWEPVIIRRAGRVIVPNEFLKQEMRKRYGVEALIIRNITNAPLPELPKQTKHLNQEPQESIRIVYTGAIYEAHFDAFKNLLKTIKSLGNNYRLIVYTDQPLDYLKNAGLDGPIEFHPRVSPAEAHQIQKNADILFLPLAFNSPYPEIIRTSAPGKVADYLATGRPILVHAPADCFVTEYFRKHECGIVVDKLDETALSIAIKKIDKNPELRKKLGKNAIDRVKEEFDISQAKTDFKNCINNLTLPMEVDKTNDSAEDFYEVSLIIPTYNRAQYITQAIDSVLRQNINSLEILVVDDGSTDNTKDVLENYSDKIRYIRKRNGGVAAARNHGIRLARGKYIAFLDSDDLFRPGKLEKQLQYMNKHPETVLVYCWHKYFRPNISFFCAFQYRASGKVYPKILHLCSVAPLKTPTIFVRRDVLVKCNGFDESMALAEDTDLWCRVSEHGPFGCIPEVLLDVRLHDNNLSDTTETSTAISVWLRIIEKAFQSDQNLGRFFKRKAKAIIFYHAWEKSLRDHTPNSWKYLLYSLFLWPFLFIHLVGKVSKSIISNIKIIQWTRLFLRASLNFLLPKSLYNVVYRWWKTKKPNQNTSVIKEKIV